MGARGEREGKMRTSLVYYSLSSLIFYVAEARRHAGLFPPSPLSFVARCILITLFLLRNVR